MEEEKEICKIIIENVDSRKKFIKILRILSNLTEILQKNVYVKIENDFLTFLVYEKNNENKFKIKISKIFEIRILDQNDKFFFIIENFKQFAKKIISLNKIYVNYFIFTIFEKSSSEKFFLKSEIFSKNFNLKIRKEIFKLEKNLFYETENKELIFCLGKNKFKYFNSFDKCINFKTCLKKNFIILESFLEKIEIKIFIEKKELYIPFIIEKYAKKNNEFHFRKKLFKNFLDLIENIPEEKINLFLKKQNDKLIFIFQNLSKEISLEFINFQDIQYFLSSSESEEQILDIEENKFFENKKILNFQNNKKLFVEDKNENELVKTDKKEFLRDISNFEVKKKIFDDFCNDYSSSEYSVSC